jgi:hypothetical protein
MIYAMVLVPITVAGITMTACDQAQGKNTKQANRPHGAKVKILVEVLREVGVRSFGEPNTRTCRTVSCIVIARRYPDSYRENNLECANTGLSVLHYGYPFCL